MKSPLVHFVLCWLGLCSAALAEAQTSVEAPPEVVQRLLGDAANSTDVQMVTRRWNKSFVVVLLTSSSREGALGLFRAGDEPWAKRFIAASGALAVPSDEEITKLDLAPYKVTTSETAIGLRFHRQRGYAGGGGEATVLRLYLRQDERLVPVLVTTVEFSCLLAGSWNEDGSREHQEVSGGSAIAVSKQTTNGHRDLVQGDQVFHWNGTRYVPAKNAQAGCEIADERE